MVVPPLPQQLLWQRPSDPAMATGSLLHGLSVLTRDPRACSSLTQLLLLISAPPSNLSAAAASAGPLPAILPSRGLVQLTVQRSDSGLLILLLRWSCPTLTMTSPNPMLVPCPPSKKIRKLSLRRQSPVHSLPLSDELWKKEVNIDNLPDPV